jgi:hypothetical protein
MCAYGGPASCVVMSATATCPAGQAAISGGYEVNTANSSLSWSKRTGTTGWSVIVTNYGNTAPTLKAHVVCAAGPGVSALRSLSLSGNGFAEALATARENVYR